MAGFNDAESTPRLTNLSTLTTVRRRAAEAVGAPDCHRSKATAAGVGPSVRPGLGGGLASRSFVPRRRGRPATRPPPRIAPGPLAGSRCPADRSRRDSRSHRPPQGGPWGGRPSSRLLHNVLDHAHGVGARAVALKERPPVRPLSSSSAIPLDEQRLRDLWAWVVEPGLQVADFRSAERLRRVDLPVPRPGRNTWPPYQAVGEALWREGWRGLLAPSAARPMGGVVLCLFRGGADTLLPVCPSYRSEEVR
jgi:hypothetical protein